MTWCLIHVVLSLFSRGINVTLYDVWSFCFNVFAA